MSLTRILFALNHEQSKIVAVGLKEFKTAILEENGTTLSFGYLGRNHHLLLGDQIAPNQDEILTGALHAYLNSSPKCEELFTIFEISQRDLDSNLCIEHITCFSALLHTLMCRGSSSDVEVSEKCDFIIDRLITDHLDAIMAPLKGSSDKKSDPMATTLVHCTLGLIMNMCRYASACGAGGVVNTERVFYKVISPFAEQLSDILSVGRSSSGRRRGVRDDVVKHVLVPEGDRDDAGEGTPELALYTDAVTFVVLILLNILSSSPKKKRGGGSADLYKDLTGPKGLWRRCVGSLPAISYARHAETSADKQAVTAILGSRDEFTNAELFLVNLLHIFNKNLQISIMNKLALFDSGLQAAAMALHEAEDPHIQELAHKLTFSVCRLLRRAVNDKIHSKSVAAISTQLLGKLQNQMRKYGHSARYQEIVVGILKFQPGLLAGVVSGIGHQSSSDAEASSAEAQVGVGAVTAQTCWENMHFGGGHMAPEARRYTSTCARFLTNLLSHSFADEHKQYCTLYSPRGQASTTEQTGDDSSSRKQSGGDGEGIVLNTTSADEGTGGGLARLVERVVQDMLPNGLSKKELVKMVVGDLPEIQLEGLRLMQAILARLSRICDAVVGGGAGTGSGAAGGGSARFMVSVTCCAVIFKYLPDVQQLMNVKNKIVKEMQTQTRGSASLTLTLISFVETVSSLLRVAPHCFTQTSALAAFDFPRLLDDVISWPQGGSAVGYLCTVATGVDAMEEDEVGEAVVSGEEASLLPSKLLQKLLDLQCAAITGTYTGSATALRWIGGRDDAIKNLTNVIVGSNNQPWNLAVKRSSLAKLLALCQAATISTLVGSTGDASEASARNAVCALREKALEIVANILRSTSLFEAHCSGGGCVVAGALSVELWAWLESFAFGCSSNDSALAADLCLKLAYHYNVEYCVAAHEAVQPTGKTSKAAAPVQSLFSPLLTVGIALSCRCFAHQAEELPSFIKKHIGAGRSGEAADTFFGKYCVGFQAFLVGTVMVPLLGRIAAGGSPAMTQVAKLLKHFNGTAMGSEDDGDVNQLAGISSSWADADNSLDNILRDALMIAGIKGAAKGAHAKLIVAAAALTEHLDGPGGRGDESGYRAQCLLHAYLRAMTILVRSDCAGLTHVEVTATLTQLCAITIVLNSRHAALVGSGGVVMFGFSNEHRVLCVRTLTTLLGQLLSFCDRLQSSGVAESKGSKKRKSLGASTKGAATGHSEHLELAERSCAALVATVRSILAACTTRSSPATGGAAWNVDVVDPQMTPKLLVSTLTDNFDLARAVEFGERACYGRWLRQVLCVWMEHYCTSTADTTCRGPWIPLWTNFTSTVNKYLASPAAAEGSTGTNRSQLCEFLTAMNRCLADTLMEGDSDDAEAFVRHIIRLDVLQLTVQSILQEGTSGAATAAEQGAGGTEEPQGLSLASVAQTCRCATYASALHPPACAQKLLLYLKARGQTSGIETVSALDEELLDAYVGLRLGSRHLVALAGAPVPAHSMFLYRSAAVDPASNGQGLSSLSFFCHPLSLNVGPAAAGRLLDKLLAAVAVVTVNEIQIEASSARSDSLLLLLVQELFVLAGQFPLLRTGFADALGGNDAVMDQLLRICSGTVPSSVESKHQTEVAFASRNLMVQLFGSYAGCEELMLNQVELAPFSASAAAFVSCQRSCGLTLAALDGPVAQAQAVLRHVASMLLPNFGDFSDDRSAGSLHGFYGEAVGAALALLCTIYQLSSESSVKQQVLNILLLCVHQQCVVAAARPGRDALGTDRGAYDNSIAHTLCWHTLAVGGECALIEAGALALELSEGWCRLYVDYCLGALGESVHLLARVEEQREAHTGIEAGTEGAIEYDATALQGYECSHTNAVDALEKLFSLRMHSATLVEGLSVAVGTGFNALRNGLNKCVKRHLKLRMHCRRTCAFLSALVGSTGVVVLRATGGTDAPSSSHSTASALFSCTRVGGEPALLVPEDWYHPVTLLDRITTHSKYVEVLHSVHVKTPHSEYITPFRPLLDLLLVLCQTVIKKTRADNRANLIPTKQGGSEAVQTDVQPLKIAFYSLVNVYYGVLTEEQCAVYKLLGLLCEFHKKPMHSLQLAPVGARLGVEEMSAKLINRHTNFLFTATTPAYVPPPEPQGRGRGHTQGGFRERSAAPSAVASKTPDMQEYEFENGWWGAVLSIPSIYATLARFPLNLATGHDKTTNPVTTTTGSMDLVGAEREGSGGVAPVYDVRFWVPAALYSLLQAPDVSVRVLVNSGMLGLIIASLCSTDEKTRAQTLVCLELALTLAKRQSHEVDKEFRERPEIVHLLEFIQNSIEPDKVEEPAPVTVPEQEEDAEAGESVKDKEKGKKGRHKDVHISMPRFSATMAIFLGEASLHLMQPAHAFYARINKYLLSKPYCDHKDIPLFDILFVNNHTANAATLASPYGSGGADREDAEEADPLIAERLYLLRVLRNGLLEHADHLNLCRKHGYTRMLALFALHAKHDLRLGKAILDILERALEARHSARYLVTRCMLPRWLFETTSSLLGDIHVHCSRGEGVQGVAAMFDRGCFKLLSTLLMLLRKCVTVCHVLDLEQMQQSGTARVEKGLDKDDQELSGSEHATSTEFLLPEVFDSLQRLWGLACTASHTQTDQEQLSQQFLHMDSWHQLVLAMWEYGDISSTVCAPKWTAEAGGDSVSAQHYRASLSGRTWRSDLIFAATKIFADMHQKCLAGAAAGPTGAKTMAELGPRLRFYLQVLSHLMGTRCVAVGMRPGQTWLTDAETLEMATICCDSVTAGTALCPAAEASTSSDAVWMVTGATCVGKCANEDVVVFVPPPTLYSYLRDMTGDTDGAAAAWQFIKCGMGVGLPGRTRGCEALEPVTQTIACLMRSLGSTSNGGRQETLQSISRWCLCSYSCSRVEMVPREAPAMGSDASGARHRFNANLLFIVSRCVRLLSKCTDCVWSNSGALLSLATSCDALCAHSPDASANAATCFGLDVFTSVVSAMDNAGSTTGIDGTIGELLPTLVGMIRASTKGKGALTASCTSAITVTAEVRHMPASWVGRDFLPVAAEVPRSQPAEKAPKKRTLEPESEAESEAEQVSNDEMELEHDHDADCCGDDCTGCGHDHGHCHSSEKRRREVREDDATLSQRPKKVRLPSFFRTLSQGYCGYMVTNQYYSPNKARRKSGGRRISADVFEYQPSESP